MRKKIEECKSGKELILSEFDWTDIIWEKPQKAKETLEKEKINKHFGSFWENIYSLKEEERVEKEEMNRCIESLQENFLIYSKKSRK